MSHRPKTRTLPYYLIENAKRLDIRLVGSDFNSAEYADYEDNPLNPDFDKIKSFIQGLAKKNPAYFPKGLSNVIESSMGDKIMGIERFWLLDGTPDLEKGYVLRINSDTQKFANPEDRDNPFYWNASFCLSRAIEKRHTGIPLDFGEEYAVESLWHEIRHSQAIGWSNIKSNTDKTLLRSMEIVNEYCARRTYDVFANDCGLTISNQLEIINHGYGYRNTLIDFDSFLHENHISQDSVLSTFKETILNIRYEEIDNILLEFLVNEAKISKYDARLAIGNFGKI